MPTVVGYILVTHHDELGHAMSLENVEREANELVMTWKGSWEKYINTLDQVGLLDFLGYPSSDANGSRDDHNAGDGLGHAMSLENVERGEGTCYDMAGSVGKVHQHFGSSQAD
ncbi:hypothetical protein OIU78_019563 [Salix suchowensis]|nr:hypothetical protein OIU78_019563 [Salix suchowensis]